MRNENNNSIRIGYVNPKYRKPKRKLNFKLIGTSVAAIGAAAIIGVTGSSIVQSFRNFLHRSEVNVPKEKASIVFNIELEPGDTVSEIASKYYHDDTEEVYGSFSNYKKHIDDENRQYIDDMYAGDIVQIPVIVDKDNPYYLEVENIKKQINAIEQNNYWVRYKVQYGDSLSTLALLASGNDREIYELTNKICDKNNISPRTLINEGDEIWILNPELGRLKNQLNSALEQFRLSLEHSQVKK